MASLLEARIAREQEAARLRAEGLRRVLPRVASLLRDRGATRVALFGSLARKDGVTPHANTDVDLCVWGLPEREWAKALFDCAALARCHVDLVRWEDASDVLREAIQRDGVEVMRVAG